MTTQTQQDQFDTSSYPIEVLRSAAGYYIGQCCPEEGPISRLSVQYWKTESDAEAALVSGNWAVREWA